MNKHASAPRPRIYDYLDYRDYLRDQVAYLKRHEGISLRALRVPKAGGGTYSAQFLHTVVRGDKPLPESMALDLARALGNGEREAQFFERLVRYTLAETPEQKQTAFDRLAWRAEFRDSQGIGSRQRLDFVTHAHVGDIYLLTALPDFRPDPAWLGSRLLLPVTPGQIAEALDILVDLGLLTRDGEGDIRRAAGPRPEPTHGEDALFRLYHQAQCDKARRALDKLPADQRRFNTWGVSRFSADNLRRFADELEQRVGALLTELVAKYESQPDQRGDLVAQINLQLFPVNVSGTSEGGAP